MGMLPVLEGIDAAPRRWQGRNDGLGAEHARWHNVVTPFNGDASGICLIGFASDEGVRRNHGRPGAAAGPAALREQLASLAARVGPVADCGDVKVLDADLEAGQQALAEGAAAVLDAGGLPVVLGGGHEVAWASYLGLSRSADGARDSVRHGVFNLDAHFDLRTEERATSGTPFLQMAHAEADRGRTLNYAVAGISPVNNTPVLFRAAEELGVAVLLDEDCADAAAVDIFVDAFIERTDRIHLTIDLDCLPAAVAPGVSAPAGFGIELATARRICGRIGASGKLALLDIAELNPGLDVDHRTARTGARLLEHTLFAHRTSGAERDRAASAG